MANMQPRPYLQPGIFDAFPELITAQSTRLGGEQPIPLRKPKFRALYQRRSRSDPKKPM